MTLALVGVGVDNSAKLRRDNLFRTFPAQQMTAKYGLLGTIAATLALAFIALRRILSRK